MKKKEEYKDRETLQIQRQHHQQRLEEIYSQRRRTNNYRELQELENWEQYHTIQIDEINRQLRKT